MRVDITQALDIHAALCTVYVYNTLTIERAWSPDQVQTWWAEFLPHLLLSPT
ncbi:hypothetical protein [Kribbella catacumbae]|uniref:hypothetical protein n=1 Tax=Kribbella catacumbae TaxID=460086 RepID=UPI00036B4502|nr:hypothetical protein [Kribbella catacumbae]